MVDKIDLVFFRERLEAMLKGNRALAKKVGDSAQTVTLDQNSVGRLSRMDALQGQAMAQASVERQTLLGRSIKAALERIKQGDYGRCLECDEFIAAARLKIDPVAEYCILCAEQRESG